ncbi:MAG: hypothetical protein EOO53_13930 [Gammaproteobacteria bacterium]|nr:MAG: hypothetical protein EOO53_13930 [Gammaproteobacteria bacterium]
MAWSSNNRACKTVWSTLMALDQISESQTFKTTGIIKIGDLRFFPIDGTQAVLDVRAQSLALQLDKIFRLIRGATYEADVDQLAAVTALELILKDKEKTVADLADEADSKYLFFKEGE